MPGKPRAGFARFRYCESCHLGTLANVSGLIPANTTRTAPGTLFATPAPTTAQIHAGVTGGCNACHDTGASWMGMSNYPISPSTFVMGGRYWLMLMMAAFFESVNAYRDAMRAHVTALAKR